MLPAAPLRPLDTRAGPIAAWQARARWQLILAIAMPAIALLHLFDEPAFYYFLKREFRSLGFFLPDWYQVLRQTGNMSVWLIVALLLWGVCSARTGVLLARRSVRLPWLVLAGAAGSGIAAELVKLIVARERPITGASLDYQGYVHHLPLIGPLLGQGNLGFPSSHTAVAFGAAFTLGRLIPGTFPVMLFLALGCAWTRLLMGAHFLTDAAGGLVVAWVWVTWLRPETRLPMWEGTR